MLKVYTKYIFLLLGFNLCCLFLFADSSFLKAQTDDDSATMYKDFIDEEEEPEENTTGESTVFLKKADRYSEWQPFQQRNIPDSVISRLKRQEAFWYADLAGKTEKKPESNKTRSTPVGQQGWFRTLIWLVILVGFAAFLITYLSGSNVGLFRKKNIIISEQENEEMPEDIFAINYQKEIDKATSSGNYRLAVRLMFLRLLKNMAERNIINYKQDKTNFDYLSELYASSNYQQFFKVTRNYEYSWYGQFDITEEAYQVIRSNFDVFENQLTKVH